MILSTIALTLSDADRVKVIASLVPVIGATRTRVGCRACTLSIDVDDPRVIHLREEWESEEPLNQHLRSETYRLVLAAIEYSQSAPTIRFDTVMASAGIETIEAARLPQAGRDRATASGGHVK